MVILSDLSTLEPWLLEYCGSVKLITETKVLMLSNIVYFSNIFFNYSLEYLGHALCFSYSEYLIQSSFWHFKTVIPLKEKRYIFSACSFDIFVQVFFIAT